MGFITGMKSRRFDIYVLLHVFLNSVYKNFVVSVQKEAPFIRDERYTFLLV